MASRKLQTEIDRTLKKVTEGVETFNDIWDKVNMATNSSQKEKYEADLKKEIKKLQRHRDQIKSWASSNEIKDKSPLLDARKLIETQMERFKAFERESKTKQYSKEGLSKGEKLSSQERQKMELRTWLNDTLKNLEQEIEVHDAEVENLQANKRKSRADTSKMERCQEMIERHHYHIDRLENVLRRLDNETIEIEIVEDLREMVNFYLEDPDAVEDEEVYASVDDLEEEVMHRADDEKRSTSDKKEEDKKKKNDENDDVVPKKSKEEKEDKKDEKPREEKKDRSRMDKASHQEADRRVGGKESSKTHTLPAAATPNPAPAHPASTASGAPSYGAAAAMGTATAAAPGPLSFAAHARSQPTTPTLTPTVPTPVPHLPATGIVNSSGGSGAAPLHAPTRASEQPALPTPVSNGAAPKSAAGSAAGSAPQVPPVGGLMGTALNQTRAGKPGNVRSTAAAAPGPTPAGAMGPFPGAADTLTSPAPAATAPPQNVLAPMLPGSGVSVSPSVASSPAATILDPVAAAMAELSQADFSTESLPSGPAFTGPMLEHSMKTLPDGGDDFRKRGYTPASPAATPSFFPTTPPPALDKAPVYERFDLDTLFFIFYYQQHTYNQYLAARELKKQSWRYHKKYLTWFQRHDEPKITTDEYEQGTYVYFDYETGWCQRIKAEFRFDYRYLEDELPT